MTVAVQIKLSVDEVKAPLINKPLKVPDLASSFYMSASALIETESLNIKGFETLYDNRNK